MANIGGQIDSCTSKVYSSYIKRPELKRLGTKMNFS